MKFSERTLEVLDNFSKINPGIVLKPGKVLRTISTNKAILAEAEVKETFDREFGIYDLGKLLGVLSLHDDTELAINDSCVELIGLKGRSKTRVRYTETKLIPSPPDKKINIPGFDVEFKLSVADFNWIDKMGSVLKCPYVVISSKEGKLVLSAADVKGEVVDDSDLDLGVDVEDTFKFVLKVENLKLIEGDYDVSISAKGIARFKSPDVTYHVAIEQGSSSFGDKAA